MFSKMSLYWDSGWELQNIWQGIEESLRLERSEKREKKEAQMKRKVMFMDDMQHVEKNISVTLRNSLGVN